MSETERRFSIPRDGQFRTRAEDGNLYIEGYFAVYNSRYDLWDGAYETIAPGAFDGETEGDVRALTNHDTTLVLGLSLIHICARDSAPLAGRNGGGKV